MDKVIPASRLIIGRTVLATPSIPGAALPATASGLRAVGGNGHVSIASEGLAAPHPAVDMAALRLSIEQDLRAEWQAQQRDALALEREAARGEGFAEGMAQGLAQAQAAGQRATADLEAELRQRHAALLPRLQQAHAEAIASDQTEIGTLAFAAVCRIAGELAGQREFMLGIVDRVCRDARAGTGAIVRVHPRDRRLLAEEGNETWSLPGGPSLTLQSDDTIALGGCQVETEAGQFDGTLSTQLQRLHAAWCAAGNAALD